MRICDVSKLHKDTLPALLFLLILFVMCMGTVCRFFFFEKEENTSQAAVLAGNGTDLLEGGNLQDGTANLTENLAVNQNTLLAGYEKQFANLQENITAFTQDLFLKDAFISFNTNHSLILGEKYLQSTQVLQGEEDWLFYKTQTDGQPLQDYMGTNLYTEEELTQLSQNILQTRDYFEKEKNIPFVVLELPNKETIYGEYMPETVPVISEYRRADQVYDYLHAQTDVHVLYPKQIFLDRKDDYQLFYKTDTHWNQLGAYLGVQALLQDVYGTQFHEIDLDDFSYDEYFIGDLATIAGIADKVDGDQLYWYHPDKIDEKQYQDKCILIIGDSFAGFMSAVIAPYFKEVHAVSYSEFNEGLLEEYQPDLVVRESVERLIDRFRTDNILAVQY